MRRAFDHNDTQGEEQNAGKQDENHDKEVEHDGGSFALQSKLKFLWLELTRSKRSLNESRKELEMMRKKNREMESLVSVIQRAWSQLDIDTSLLLDGLADPDVEIPSPNSQLLKDFIRSSDQYLYQDPTNLSPLPQLLTDQWSSAEEIKKEETLAIESLQPLHPFPEDHNEKLEDHPTNKAEVKCFGEILEDHLVGHISFTFSILERLCYALSDGVSLTDNVEVLKSLQVLKESKAKEAMLLDGISKLETELYHTEAKYRICENQKLKTEKQLDRANHHIKELEGKLSRIGDGSNTGGEVKEVSMSLSNESSQEFYRQINLLEKQLAESESAKAEAEMHLTERISRPLMQADAQVSDMRKAMEDLRSQCKQRVNHLLGENEALHQKVRDLQLALSQVETASAKKIDDFVSALEQELSKLRQEKISLEQKMNHFDHTIEIQEQSKLLLRDYQQLDESKNQSVTSAQEKVRSLQATNRQLSRNLEKSRKREKYLEGVLSHYAIQNPKSQSSGGTPVPMLGEASTPRSEEVVTEMDVGAVMTESEKFTIDQVSLQLVKQSQERCTDLEQELQQVKSQVNDLITEIEAISTSEQTTREQSEALLKRISESHSMQQAALEENLKLINELDEARVSKTEAESRCELMKGIMVERDRILTQLRSEEFSLMNEINTLKKSLKDLEENKNASKDLSDELQQKLDDLKVKIQDTSKRNQDLQARCNELSKQCQRERKLRMEEQRKDKKTALKREPSFSEETAAPVNQHDNDMLEMTLGMLRCSVCKDRFKSATIKKCFHLFCRECIDENIRSRLRKCPACGEKFGQDDVANIYFTN